MAFITTGSGICLSPSGETVYPICGKIIREGEKKYILTEDGRMVLVDGDCSDPALPSFSCNFPRKNVDSGKSVVISNTCSLSITITGFTNSDPERFTIFEYPKYLGMSIYETGTVSQLPITIEPFETTTIPTFFNPLESDLEDGTAGTFDNRIGDQFSSRFEIYPGFPVLNCSSNEFDCDAYFTLSGEFICDEIDIPEFLSNNKNFINIIIFQFSKNIYIFVGHIFFRLKSVIASADDIYCPTNVFHSVFVRFRFCC